MVLRAYAKYLRQAGIDVQPGLHGGHPPQQRPHHPAAGRAVRGPVVARSRQRRRHGADRRRCSRRSTAPSTRWPAWTRTASCAPSSTVIKATLRTNFFQRGGRRRAARRTSSSSSTRRPIPDLPAPRPKFEIWVYSPRVEGVHLRFGPVARGGLRWSDRREDFRTEILGLVKAQMVKNAVIVPVGAKGGFVAKQLPDPSVDRDAWLAEGIACYRTFISGAARHHRQPRRPARSCRRADVVRHDGDDPYLVVAADKGTATFSDIANEVAADVRLLARRRLRLRRLGRLRPQGHGHHRPRRLGVGQAALPRAGPSTPRPRTSPSSASATCPVTCSATACCCPSTSGWSPPSTTGTSSSTRTRTRPTSYAERRRLFELPRSLLGRLRHRR